MPALSFFAIEDDLPVLIEHFNADPEIAFIVSDDTFEGPNPFAQVQRRWRAERSVSTLRDGEHSLWHIPAGPLPFVSAGNGIGPLVRPPDPLIPDPWSGWTAPGGMLDGGPWFGPGCHAEIRLSLSTRYAPYSETERKTLPVLVSYWTQGREFLASSDFQWTGGHFRSAPRETTKWWHRLKTWMRKAAVPLPTHHPHVTFWSFPLALEALKRGVAYSANNWPLDEAIRNATPSTRRR